MDNWEQRESEYNRHYDPYGYEERQEIIETCEKCNCKFDASISDAESNHNFCSKECEV
jgi:hypothetical protein